MSESSPLNSQPRPRALFQDLDAALTEALRPLFPTVRSIASDDVVHDDEFDVLITTSRSRRSAHLHVVAFGVLPDGPFFVADSTPGAARYMERLRWNGTSYAQELRVPPSLDPALGRLVRQQLYPLLDAQTVKATVTLEYVLMTSMTHHDHLPPPVDCVDPFLLSGADGIVAGAYNQADGEGAEAGRVWFLPVGLDSPAAWVQLALRDFSSRDPDRVPPAPDWWTTGTWATPAQASARSSLAEKVARRHAVILGLDAEVSAAESAIADADTAASSGALRLLTADGDELEAAVADAFRAFGFLVAFMDGVYPVGDRREDLQLRDPDDGGWIALVEIKGYSRGASVNDLARIERHTIRYMAENGGALPSAKFHVVNAFKGTDPTTRPRAIPNDAELTEFAAGGGLLIDSRDLFAAWCEVESGAKDPGQIRRSVREATMRWTWPRP